MLGRRLRELLQPRELAVGLLAHVVGQLEHLELGAQVVHLGLGRVLLPQLLLDRLELLAQDIVALRALHLRHDLRLDLRADGDDVQLAREHLGEPPQPLGDVDLLQQRLLLLDLDPQRAGDQVRERGRVLEVGHRHLQLLGEVGDLLDDVRERLLDVAHQRGQLRPLLDLVGQLADLRHEVGLLAHPAVDLHALAGLDEDPQAAVGDLEHARDDARDPDGVQLVGPRRLEVRVPGAEHDEHPVAGQHVVDELDRAVLADRQRRQRVRVGDRVAQRQHGELVGQGDGNVVRERAHRSVPRIGTVRGRAGRLSGSSTVRIPSS